MIWLGQFTDQIWMCTDEQQKCLENDVMQISNCYFMHCFYASVNTPSCVSKCLDNLISKNFRFICKNVSLQLSQCECNIINVTDLLQCAMVFAFCLSLFLLLLRAPYRKAKKFMQSGVDQLFPTSQYIIFCYFSPKPSEQRW